MRLPSCGKHPMNCSGEGEAGVCTYRTCFGMAGTMLVGLQAALMSGDLFPCCIKAIRGYREYCGVCIYTVDAVLWTCITVHQISLSAIPPHQDEQFQAM